MVQDYHYLNKGTIKNNYPLPLIPELIDRIGDAYLQSWIFNGAITMQLAWNIPDNDEQDFP